MGATPVDFIIQGIREGVTDNTQLAERAGISADKMKMIYRKDKKTFDGLKKLIAKEKKNCSSKMSEGNKNGPSEKNELRLADKNPFHAKYTDNTKTKLSPDQLPEYDLWNMLETGEARLNNLLMSFHQICLDKTRIKLDSIRAVAINALNIISMPWLPENNWKSSILRRKDPAGNIFLHLQRSISFELKEAIQVVLKEINRKEGKISLEQKSSATQPPQPRPYYEISAECPYKDINETYAVIWQILKDNQEGISREALKDKAIEITGKSSEEIDEAIVVVTSRKNIHGEGCDERALPGHGYWVEECFDGQLKIRFPVPIDDEGQEGETGKSITI